MRKLKHLGCIMHRNAVVLSLSTPNKLLSYHHNAEQQARIGLLQQQAFTAIFV
jgi:hypothetical protein